MRLALVLAFAVACGHDDATVSVVDASTPVEDAEVPADAAAAVDASDAAPPNALRGQGILHTSGRTIVDAAGATIALRGTNLGNWLMLETWMTSVTGTNLDSDYAIRQKVETRFPGTTASLFADNEDRYLTDTDLASFASMGMDLVRLPFPYWLFESDARVDVPALHR